MTPNLLGLHIQQPLCQTMSSLAVPSNRLITIGFLLLCGETGKVGEQREPITYGGSTIFNGVVRVGFNQTTYRKYGGRYC